MHKGKRCLLIITRRLQSSWCGSWISTWFTYKRNTQALHVQEAVFKSHFKGCDLGAKKSLHLWLSSAENTLLNKSTQLRWSDTQKYMGGKCAWQWQIFSLPSDENITLKNILLTFLKYFHWRESSGFLFRLHFLVISNQPSWPMLSLTISEHSLPQDWVVGK